jgi:hypothetical protein
MRVSFLGICLVCVVAAGCRSGPPPGRHEEEWHSPVRTLLRYAGTDGRVTRAEMEAGLRIDFAAADTNRNGTLEPDEARAVNIQRWNEDRSAISPLQDWNGDGVIDFNEFAAAPRALFEDLDRNHDGVLTPDELRIGPSPDNPGAGPGASPDGQSGGQGGGQGGGGRRGPPGGGGRPPN